MRNHSFSVIEKTEKFLYNKYGECKYEKSENQLFF